MKLIRTSLLAVAILGAMNVSLIRAGQREMREALHHLREARAHLERAEHNKGGWRIRAIENVDRAIRETENSIAVAR